MAFQPFFNFSGDHSLSLGLPGSAQPLARILVHDFFEKMVFDPSCPNTFDKVKSKAVRENLIRPL
jgi:hypothetical protein